MNFTIVENIRNHKEWDSLKGFFTGLLKIFLFLILIPFLLVGLVISIFKKSEAEKIINEWTKFYSDENLTLERLFIDENEIPNNLDYPIEPNDIYLFQVKSTPEIPELKDIFFDYHFVKTDHGIFLLSFNEIGNGMSVWYVDSNKHQLEKVKDLESSWWDFREKDGKIILSTTLNKKDINIEIKKIG